MVIEQAFLEIFVDLPIIERILTIFSLRRVPDQVVGEEYAPREAHRVQVVRVPEESMHCLAERERLTFARRDRLSAPLLWRRRRPC